MWCVGVGVWVCMCMRACMIVHNTCKVIVDVILKRYIQFPQGDELSEVVEGFKNKWDMIQCAGSIDGCHIPLTPALTKTEMDGTLCLCRQLLIIITFLLTLCWLA